MNELIKPKEAEETAELLQFPTVIPGGKDGSSGPWILSLQEGTAFLVRPIRVQDRTLVFGQFELIKNLDNKAVFMYSSPTKEVSWFDPVRFCNTFEYVATIGIQIREEENDINRTDRSTDLEDNEASEGND